MMISYQSLVMEIEQHMAKIKNVKDEQQLREELSAIRALCSVALSNGGNQGQNGQMQNSQMQSNFMQSNQMQNSQNDNGSFWAQQNPVNQGSNESGALSGQQAQSQNSVMNNSNSINEKLKDKDANGNSIFDF